MQKISERTVQIALLKLSAARKKPKKFDTGPSAIARVGGGAMLGQVAGHGRALYLLTKNVMKDPALGQAVTNATAGFDDALFKKIQKGIRKRGRIGAGIGATAGLGSYLWARDSYKKKRAKGIKVSAAEDEPRGATIGGGIGAGVGGAAAGGVTGMGIGIGSIASKIRNTPGLREVVDAYAANPERYNLASRAGVPGRDRIIGDIAGRLTRGANRKGLLGLGLGATAGLGTYLAAKSRGEG